VGTDCFRPEGGLVPPSSPGVRIPRPGYEIICGHGKLIIENMKNLVLLPATGALIILGVIPYEDGSGGQARILALLT
jgi:kynurenine formamidase